MADLYVTDTEYPEPQRGLRYLVPARAFLTSGGYSILAFVTNPPAPGRNWYTWVYSDGGGRGAWATDRDEADEKIADAVAFNRRFWDEKVEWHLAGDRTPSGQQVVRVERLDGRYHMTLGHRTGSTPAFLRGCSGHHWVFKLFDGSQVETVDAWHQGRIPDDYLDRLPANAEQVES